MTTKHGKTHAAIGAIDRVHQGWLQGWYAAPEALISNQFNLVIDGRAYGCYKAQIYRPDVAALAIRNGLVGFNVPLPLGCLDDKTHQITLADRDKGKAVFTVKLRLPMPEGLRRIMNSLVSVQRVKAVATQKMAFYVAYTANEPLFLYHKKTITALRQAGYHVVLIMAIDDGDINVTPAQYLSDADTVIVRSNQGYDFGSWATGFYAMRKELTQIKHLLLLNDSIVGPLDSLQPMLEAFEQNQSDLWAVCNSFDHCLHVQSFCYGFHPKLIDSPYLSAFFLYRELAEDKQTAIQRFELLMHKFFTTHDFVSGHWLDYRQLASDFIKDIQIGLENKLQKDTGNLRLFHGRLVTVNFESFITNVVAHIEKGTPLNPSHYFWREILQREFPFIKKELLTVNPENNPMLMYDFGGWLNKEQDNRALFDDLSCRGRYKVFPGLLS